MPRPCKRRWIAGPPAAMVYKPAGVPSRDLEWIRLNLDEFEAVRLIDHLGMDQEQAAGQMGVSRPTVTRIYAAARKKIGDALVKGCALLIEGGPDVVEAGPCDATGPADTGKRCGCGRHRHGHHHHHDTDNQTITDKEPQ